MARLGRDQHLDLGFAKLHARRRLLRLPTVPSTTITDSGWSPAIRSCTASSTTTTWAMPNPSRSSRKVMWASPALMVKPARESHPLADVARKVDGEDPIQR